MTLFTRSSSINYCTGEDGSEKDGGGRGEREGWADEESEEGDDRVGG